VPDLDAPAIVIPDSVEDLVLLGDSTSDEFTTRLAMCRAAARYAAPGRRVRVAWAPAGLDFDDLWRLAASDAERARRPRRSRRSSRRPRRRCRADREPELERARWRRRARAIASQARRMIKRAPATPARRSTFLPTRSTSAFLTATLPAILRLRSGLRRRRPRRRRDGEKKSKPSRMGRSRKNAGADRGKWGGGDRDLDGEELDRALAYYP
jgi:hypothetical protein